MELSVVAQLHQCCLRVIYTSWQMALVWPSGRTEISVNQLQWYLALLPVSKWERDVLNMPRLTYMYTCIASWWTYTLPKLQPSGHACTKFPSLSSQFPILLSLTRHSMWVAMSKHQLCHLTICLMACYTSCMQPFGVNFKPRHWVRQVCILL